LRENKFTDTDIDTAMELHKWAAVKSPLGAQTVLGDRHDLICEICLQIPSAACGTRPRELSSGWARKRIRVSDTDTDTDTDTETVTEMHKWAAVKSPLGAQTVLGDRHDPIYEICLQIPSAACGTRPRELSSGWGRKRMSDGFEKRSSENLIRQRLQRNDLNPGEFASRAGVRVGEAQHV